MGKWSQDSWFIYDMVIYISIIVMVPVLHSEPHTHSHTEREKHITRVHSTNLTIHWTAVCRWTWTWLNNFSFILYICGMENMTKCSNAWPKVKIHMRRNEIRKTVRITRKCLLDINRIIQPKTNLSPSHWKQQQRTIARTFHNEMLHLELVAFGLSC